MPNFDRVTARSAHGSLLASLLMFSARPTAAARYLARPDPVPNDGGLVLLLFLMVAAISFAMLGAVSAYAAAVPGPASERKEARRMRLYAGWANAGNGVVHALLVLVLYANRQSPLPFYVAELEAGLAGPIGLMVINAAVGLRSLRGGGPSLALAWNGFAAAAGTLLPIVWLRFVEEGLSSWPHVAVLLWLGIFWMELGAAACSAAWYALS